MTATVEELLHPLRMSERAALISRGHSAAWPSPGALPGGTAYMCTIDGTGRGVSLMQSNFLGIGSGISAGKHGVWLHSRGAGFSLIPSHPNEFAPGKRPAHTLSPTLWTREGNLAMLLGSRGGDFQPQLVAQLAANILHLDMDLGEAQSMPRWGLEHFGPGTDSAPGVEDAMNGNGSLLERIRSPEDLRRLPRVFGEDDHLHVRQIGNRIQRCGAQREVPRADKKDRRN